MMKYLNYYKKFFEDLSEDDDLGLEDEIVEPSEDMTEEDSADVKIAEEELHKLQIQLKEYKSNKSKIDSMYNNLETQIDEAELSKIIGDEDERNDFLLSYANIKSLERKINKLQNSISKDELNIDKLEDGLDNISDELMDEYNDRIEQRRNDMGVKQKQLQDAMKQLPKLEAEHKEKMTSIEKRMKDWVNKISK